MRWRGRIKVCRDKLREVCRIHGRRAAKLPARLFGVRREAVTDMTAVKWKTRGDQRLVCQQRAVGEQRGPLCLGCGRHRELAGVPVDAKGGRRK